MSLLKKIATQGSLNKYIYLSIYQMLSSVQEPVNSVFGILEFTTQNKTSHI